MPVGYRATSQPERIVNKSYKTIFNKTLGVWQAVAEIARAQGKSKNAITPPAGQ
ncbi:MAG: ESPR domain-containing protein [Azonexus sp.]|nr:ESPR domain-containing protein [Azonexus sp.]